MTARELDAAEIRDPLLREAYALCETILQDDNHASHTWMRDQLRLDQRPYWDAMIAFCGHADDLADAQSVPLTERLRLYDAFTRDFFRMLQATRQATPAAVLGTLSGTAGRRSPGDGVHLVSLAFCDVIHTWRLSETGVRRAGDALRADMTLEAYDTVAALERYMLGVSGEPSRWLATLLGQRGAPLADGAENAAIAWGFGLQTLDFLLDIEEDLRLGKLYVPLDDLRACGLSRPELEAAVAARQPSQPLRDVVARQLVRVRRYFADAERWIDHARPVGWEAVRDSLAEGRATVDRLTRCHHDVFALTAETT
ncbi:squalene/phytoene synthase family protein [Streptomyces sp. NPDC057702]|uniref:squalene/phytoene synthase family protein n=1 Tax=unclassified Streptomyces TaxID=2593676 RepID=UPI0036A5C6C3